jgi:hypothetical protein
VRENAVGNINMNARGEADDLLHLLFVFLGITRRNGWTNYCWHFGVYSFVSSNYSITLMPSKQNYDLEPLLNAHQQQLGLVMSEADSIDSKALAILAIIVAVLIFIAQAGLHLSGWPSRMALLGPHLLALLFSGLAIWPRQYIGPSVDIDTYLQNLKLPHDALVLQLLANTDYAIGHASKINRQRWIYCVSSVVFLLIGTAVLFAIL